MNEQEFVARFIADLGKFENDIVVAARVVERIGEVFPQVGRQADGLVRKMTELGGGALKAASDLQKAAAQSSRAYGNLSVHIDAGIEARQREAKAWSAVLQSRMRDEVALGRVTQATDNLANASPRLRYALYDVASTATVAGAALLGLSVGTAAVAIRFQRDFADVARVTNLTGPALQRLREDFNDLYRSIPVGFDELTKIGTLAGQLDIADSSIASFTETVAKFSATSGVAVEQSATALGRLAQLLPDVGDDYEGLADAILMVGANSVSTEAQIIAIASQLAGVATTANLSSKELIALAGTLASVGTAPELSRGAITRLFANIETAIAAGGERLQAFATVSGRTATQFREDWGNESFAVIQDLFAGIGSAGGDMGGVLSTLGIVASRDIPVFQKLAQQAGELGSNFGNAANSAGEVNRQYNIIASTMAEKINVLTNNFNSLVETLGRSTLGFTWLVDAAVSVLRVLQAIAENPVVSNVGGIGVVVGALAGSFLILLGVIIRVRASILALRLALNEMGLAAGTSSLSFRALTVALTGTSGATAKATAAVKGFSISLGTLARAIPVLLAVNEAVSLISDPENYRNLSFVADGFQSLVESFGFSAEEADGAARILQSALNYMNPATVGREIERLAGAFDKMAGGALSALGASVGLGGQLDRLRGQAQGAGGAITQAGDAVSKTADLAKRDLLAELEDLIDVFTSVEQGALDFENAIYRLGQSLAENGTAFDRYSAEGRENMGALLDVIDKVAAQTPGDAATTAANLQALFNTLVRGAGVSAASLDFLRQMIAALASQAGGIGVPTLDFANFFSALESWLSGLESGADRAARSTKEVAKQVRTLVDYANDLSQVTSRAFDIRFGSQAALDEITTSWMDLNEEMAEYERKVASLTADRDVKAYFLTVAEAYGDTLRAGKLRSEIADIDAELADATAKTSKELTGNSQAAIINRQRITELLGSYGSYLKALAASGVSQDVLNAAVKRSQAEFTAQAKALGYSDKELQPYIKHFNDMAVAVDKVPTNVTVKAYTDPAMQALAELQAKIKQTTNNGSGYSVPVTTKVSADNSELVRSLTAQIQQMEAQLQLRVPTGVQLNALNLLYSALRNARGYASGGYTGNGGKFEPKGVVHGGEFVLNKQATKNAGVGNLYALQKALMSGKGFAMGGYVPAAAPVGVGSGLVGLGPDAMRELRGIKDAIREIRPGYLFPEDVSRLSQEGDRKRRNSGEL